MKCFICRRSAASFGNEKVIKHLWDHGAKINIPDVNKMTPFLCAVTAGRLDCGRLLLEYGADVSALDARGRSCLHLAVENEQEEMIALLVQNKSRTKLVNLAEPEKERTPLHYAAMAANIKVKHRSPRKFVSVENLRGMLRRSRSTRGDGRGLSGGEGGGAIRSKKDRDVGQKIT